MKLYKEIKVLTLPKVFAPSAVDLGSPGIDHRNWGPLLGFLATLIKELKNRFKKSLGQFYYSLKVKPRQANCES